MPDTRSPIQGALGLAIIAGAAYAVLWRVDHGAGLPFAALTAPENLSAVQNVGDMLISVLGVALTVVAILIELAANRYTPRVAQLFVNDERNRMILSWFVVSALLVLWIQHSAGHPPWPRTMVAAALFAISSSLALLLPYFVYVFEFLAPERVIGRIRDDGLTAMLSLDPANAPPAWRAAPRVADQRKRTAASVEQLGDLLLRCIENRDKALAVTAVDALSEVAQAHVVHKPALPTEWFQAAHLVSVDPDFVAFPPSSVARLTERRMWVEMKIVLHLGAGYARALGSLPELAHLIAIRFRQYGAVASSRADAPSADLAVRALNTAMRAALNAGNARAIFDLLEEYRLLGEASLGARQPQLALAIAQRIVDYGRLGHQRGLPLALETAAHDLAALVERAHALGSEHVDALLDLLLDVDRTPDAVEQDAALAGVRKAQIKLGTYLLEADDRRRAQLVWDDVRAERLGRLARLRAEIESVSEAEFYEITDRTLHLDWLPPERRARLGELYALGPASAATGEPTESPLSTALPSLRSLEIAADRDAPLRDDSSEVFTRW